MLRVGIVGLPNVGKSSLFNALTAARAPSENYPFCTVEPNVGTVEVPDRRLDDVHGLTGSAERVPTFMRFVDIAGLVEGASRGEGLGNQFLGQIREVDAVAHVLRCFEDPDVAHVLGSADPVRDRGIVETELALADLETVERRLERVSKKARSGEQDAITEQAVLEKLHPVLSDGRPARSAAVSPEDSVWLRGYHLLTAKPVLYVANVGEASLPSEDDDLARRLEESLVRDQAGPMVRVCCRIEAELAELEPEERREFLTDLGFGEAGLDRFIHASYDLLGLITFFTANENESRAWTVEMGTRAPQAAGRIHTDFERGFIRAETIGYDDFLKAGSMKAAREHGWIRSEGKDYVVADGDIVLFRFNV